MKVLVSGSHGMIGSELMRQLEARGDEVSRMVRTRPNPGEVHLDMQKFQTYAESFEGFDAFVHLGGAGIGEKRLTTNQQRRIWDSRVVTTELISQTIAKLSRPPATFVCASAVGYYGSQGDEFLTESSPKGKGFFAELCNMWESFAQEATNSGVRVVNTRSGVVLDKNGGALKRQLPLFKLCLGGPLGNGRQWMSWISLRDEVRAIMHILDTPSLNGPVNVTSPEPIMNGAFTASLALELKRYAIIPTPRPALVLALGRILTDELLLTSQRVIPRKLLDSGFTFELEYLQEALHETLTEPEAPEEEEAKDVDADDKTSQTEQEE